MMRKYVVLLVLCVLALPVAAEIGVSLDLGSGMRFEKSEFTPLVKATIFFTDQLVPEFGFDVRVGYAGSWSVGADALAPTEPPPLYQSLNIDTFSITGTLAMPDETGTLRYQLGRFSYYDLTGRVFGAKLDGIGLTFSDGGFSAGVTVGYTGFIFRHSSPIIMTYADLARLSITDMGDEAYSFFGSPRLIGAARIGLPPILNQNIAFSAVFQEDLASLADNGLASSGVRNADGTLIQDGDEVLPFKSGLLNTAYFSVQASGPIVPTFFYTLGYTFGSGSVLTDNGLGVFVDAPIYSHMAYATATLFVPSFLSSSYSLRFAFGSGDEDLEDVRAINGADTATAFVPVTPVSTGTIFTPSLTNLAVIELEGSIKPFAAASALMENFQIQLRALAFLRPTLGAVSDASIAVGTGSNYLGTEINTSINFRPFSDLGVSLGAGLFIGNPESYVEGAVTTQGSMRLDISFTL